MIVTLITPPTYEPVSLDEAKDHLRITSNDDDVRVTGYITAARKWAENYTGRALITQTWDQWFYAFPYASEPFYLAKAPLQSISAITYVDAAGATQTLSSGVYTVDSDSDPGRFYLTEGQAWPSTRTQEKAVKVRFNAGYGDDPSDVPREIAEAILLQIQILFEQPIDKVKEAIEDARDSLLSSYRLAYL